MRIYLDMCCLKRPFDDQGQVRIRLESEAILTLLDAPSEKIEFLRSSALDLEINQNPLPVRAAKVRQWLEKQSPLALPDQSLLKERTEALMAMGFKNFDAFHLASAELGQAEVFVSCDDRLLASANRNAAQLKVKVMDLLNLLGEVFL
jgi:hypothetical protein